MSASPSLWSTAVVIGAAVGNEEDDRMGNGASSTVANPSKAPHTSIAAVVGVVVLAVPWSTVVVDVVVDSTDSGGGG